MCPSISRASFKAVILSGTGSTRSALPVESKNPVAAAVGISLAGNSLNSIVRTPNGDLFRIGCKRSFDCVVARFANDNSAQDDSLFGVTAYGGAGFSYQTARIFKFNL
jgi:hypothetical protein